MAAIALSVGAAAWITDAVSTAPFASAALPQPRDGSFGQTSFDERFSSLSSGRSADRSAVNVLQFKLRDAKALLARQLVDDDWRTSLGGDDRLAADDVRPAQKSDIPLPRSRPAQADFAAQIASSQAYADTLPKENNRGDGRSWFQRLGDKIKLASLTADGTVFRRGPDLAALGYDSQTAVYDISAHAVYLPNGLALEAHSGMGNLKDDPDFVHQANIGATPPATYDLKPRERLFHGVRALRMIPTEDSDTLGRVGLLTHSYMLGANGDSNGCVSIKFYDRFLKAFDDGEFNRLVVVPSLDGTTTASQRTSRDS